MGKKGKKQGGQGPQTPSTDTPSGSGSRASAQEPRQAGGQPQQPAHQQRPQQGQQQPTPQQGQQQRSQPWQQQQQPPQQGQRQPPPQQGQQQFSQPWQQQQQRPHQQGQRQPHPQQGQRQPHPQQGQQQFSQPWQQQQRPPQQGQQQFSQPWQQQQRPPQHGQQQPPPQQGQHQRPPQQQHQGPPQQQQHQRPPQPELQQPSDQTPGQQPSSRPQGDSAGAPKAPAHQPSTTSDPFIEGLAKVSLKHKGTDYAALSRLIPKKADLPQEPKLGRVIPLEVNHLALKIADSKMKIYHYDVQVVPDKPFRFYRPALRRFREVVHPNNYPAFDGKKNIYSGLKLPFRGDSHTETVTIHDEERGKPVDITVTVTLVSQVDVAGIGEFLRGGNRFPQEVIQAIDIVLRQPAAAKFCQVGRSYFCEPPPERIVHLGDGMDLWYGFFQSAILGWKPYLNADVAHKGFPAPVNCIDALKEFNRGNLHPNDRVNEFAIRSLRGLVKGLKVSYNPPTQGQQPRVYKVVDIGKLPGEHRFENQDKRTVSVLQYFNDAYGYRIKFPNVPLLLCGSQQRPVALPPELCNIMKGQVTTKKLNDNQTRNMVGAAATPAFDRKQKIIDSLRMVNFNADPHIRELGLSVDNSFKKLDGRVLEAPKIEYKSREVRVNQGVWNSEQFIKPGHLSNWAIYCCERRVGSRDLQNLEKELQKIGKSLGMSLSNAQMINLQSDNLRTVEDDFRKFRENNLQLLIVILPDRGNITYAVIKRTAELNVGLLTQCLKSRTIGRLLPSTVTNILLKVNAKINGINHYISGSSEGEGWPRFLKRPVMVVGADVTHPSPDQQDIPSIAAVAASHDARAFHYNMKWRLQQPREEMIQDLENIMVEQLKFFYKKTNLKPERIMFYRDGVSDGQFAQVLGIELQAIKRACKVVQADDFEPQITFVVVQKRHHTRFFPCNPRDADRKNGNVPAGTIVDTEITHKHEMDFYLVSHASLQGTSRPTKYQVLWDDSKMSEQELEEITYYLCHLFTRCTRSVSYPAPTYYAHLAAFRIRSYIESQKIACRSLSREQESRKIHSNIMDGCPMFFV